MWQTLGQGHITAYLQDAILRGSVAHAYLFAGPPQIGKMTLAIDLAKALNCASPDRPCCACPTCRRIAEGKHADLVIIDRNTGRDAKDRRKATEISIDTIREFIQRSSTLHPYEGKYRTFIIDNAETMSTEAANCLLKTLEEPPQHVVIILLTPEEKRLLPTILSRCQRFELKPIPVADTESALSKLPGMTSERARLLARLSSGCLGWAISSATDESYLAERTRRLDEFSSLMGRSWDERLSYILQLPAERDGMEALLRLWLSFCRDVMLMKYNCIEGVANLDRVNDLKSWSVSLTVPEIKDMIDSLDQAIRDLAANANLHLLLEVLMLRMPKKERRMDFAQSSAAADG